jgi:2-polyprenyl-6-hydroxyphenyl methylase/3-demethylubiquinone-9 3-methyltransferase
MDQAVLRRLVGLPKLSRTNIPNSLCKVCGGQVKFFDVVDFNKFCSQVDFYMYGRANVTVTYFRCEICGFLFTEFFDDWSIAEFGRFVYNEDYIRVDGAYAGVRPALDAAKVAKWLNGHTQLRIIDYGSGSGILSEHLRSYGFANVTSYDPFSSPQRPDGRFDVVTCFEVLEHTTSPKTTLADIASLLDPSGCVIFSTGIQPPDMGRLRANWWYVAPRNGHASIYTLKALALAGQAEGLTLHAGPGGTGFAGPAPSATCERLLSAIGRSSRFLRLTAPSDDGVMAHEQKTSWHGIESPAAAPYRWSREADIFWRLQVSPLAPCKLTVTIPLSMEVRPGFADACRLIIGNQSAALSREANDLIATVILDEPTDPIVRLVTPPLLRPCDLRDMPDQRPLGLAIAAGPGVSPG